MRLYRVSDDFEARLDMVSLHRSDPYGEWLEVLRRDLERGCEAILDTRKYGRYESWQATGTAWSLPIW